MLTTSRVTSRPSSPNSSLIGTSFGRVQYGGASGALTAIRATAYTNKPANFTGSVVSANANDTAAGTGARTITINYYDATGAGPFSETATLNGVTAVNLVNANHCFIESIVVTTVGSGTRNAGVISLFTGAGGAGTLVGTIGTGNVIAAQGDNQTLWAHHYIADGKAGEIFGMSGGTSGNQTAVMFLRRATPTVANTPEIQISDNLVTANGGSQTSRVFANPLESLGFSRVTMYVVSNGTNTNFSGGFDFSEQ